MSHVFKLNAHRRRWRDLFDAVAGAALVIAGDGALELGQQSDMIVALMKQNSLLVIGDLTTLVMDVADAIEEGHRDEVVKMIERGRPRSPELVWGTAGRMVEIVRHVHPLDDAVIERVLAVSKLFGEHPLVGFPL